MSEQNTNIKEETIKFETIEINKEGLYLLNNLLNQIISPQVQWSDDPNEMIKIVNQARVDMAKLGAVMTKEMAEGGFDINKYRGPRN